MRNTIRLVLYCLLLFPELCFAQEGLNIVVTSSWTAAYLELAGVTKYEMMAPSNMQHPSEYELQIDDIKKLKDADLIVCGGYETMMEKIRTGLKIEPDKILQIKTDYNLEHIKSSVRSLAKRTGTIEIAQENLQEIEEFFLRPLSEELGLNISAIFGPRQLEAFDIQELMKHDFVMVIDNAHNPSGQPLAESKENVGIAHLMNFPGMNNTHSIADVIRKNVQEIINTYREGN
jgi:hypothetical protein